MPEPEHTPAPGPRPFWSGTIGFGLVSVPVDLYPAARTSAGASLRLLAPDGAPLRREYVCPADARPVADDELVRGVDLDARADGWVVVTDDELDALAPEATQAIEIRQFVTLAELSPVAFDRPYFLVPDKRALKPYRLLALVLEGMGLVGIASFVMRGHEHLAAILAEDGLLRVETLRFVAQLRTPAELGLPPVPAELDPRLVDGFAATIAAVIAAQGSDALDLDELADLDQAQTLALADRKLAAGTDVVEVPGPDGGESGGGEAEIIDLMAVLQQALALPGT